MNWSWKKFFSSLLKRSSQDLKASFWVGVGIFVLVGFLIMVFLWIYDPLDRVGQEIMESILRLSQHPVDLPSGTGFVMMVIILAPLFGKFLRIKKIQNTVDQIIFKIPLIGWIWKLVRHFQSGVENLKHYKAVSTQTFQGKEEIFLVKRIKRKKIKRLDGGYEDRGWKAEGFMPSVNNFVSGRAFISVDLETIDAIIDNRLEEIIAYIISCTISAPEPDWDYRKIDWKKDFGIDIDSKGT